MSDDAVSIFGIRHHGPGCARSLRRALVALQPDCVLIEGPAGCEPLLVHLVGAAASAAATAAQPASQESVAPAERGAMSTAIDVALQPPVALLSHCVDDPQLAVFHPYAEFSPEWQAMLWAAQAGVPVRFMDVPASASLAWQREQSQRRAQQPGEAADALDAPPDDDGTGEQETAPGAAARIDDSGDGARLPADAPTQDPATAPRHADGDDAIAPDPAAAGDERSPDTAQHVLRDPLDWLARAAGYGDGESWWNHMVEERGDGEGLFEAIAQAMTELRENAGLQSGLDATHEAMREAHMRSTLREARKQGYQRIAVVCGAWHVPALAAKVSAAADKATLRDLPKLKTQTTWVPWTYHHLSSASGYGAGIDSPGWYEHLWKHGEDDNLGPAGVRPSRAIGWFARVARLLREHELDCSSAHLIEASRLSDTLAALRDRPMPGLDELNEATRSVICNGDDTPMRLIAQRLMIGDAIGSVPTDVPTVPLQRDLEAQQKRLRLRPEALSRTVDLDLRNDTDLQRSQLLHRLWLLDIRWGDIARVGRSGRGTFHESWELAWDPRFQVELIIASRHGHTVALAATTRAIEQARAAAHLPELAALIDRVLLANLPGAVDAVAAELQARAATDADPLALLGALPALANVHRYGNVRNTDVAQVERLFDGILLRASLGLPLAMSGLDDDAAEAARGVLLAADRAIDLRQGEDQTATWQRALRIIALSESSAPLLRGACARLLLDARQLSAEDVHQQLGLNLSQGSDPLPAAQWLDGFLNRNATVLLHGDDVWPLIDAWLSGLGHGHFLRVAPLVRRTFAGFESSDRRDLGERVKQGVTAPHRAAPALQWDAARAMRALPTLRELFGIATTDAPP
ncbi:DUF5682 family protein [Montanilutibacter psychrotolerans]|uniref:Uncharacterized protein n=1 Tax=Montanilutibacter psychrotolerans TaxID=1327343 RepID=A0A3M8SN14_9GAMM|nr:DUF5682 family protein [Lysobacter psychrotolerans]RNF82619.1 hypothetical protein EER27_14035 [Lysobacter psychrotolerans]